MALASSLDQLPLPGSTPAQRMREALALFEDGVEMKRRSLKRKSPNASETELQSKLLSWLQRQDES
jgi:hypothetical protein